MDGLEDAKTGKPKEMKRLKRGRRGRGLSSEVPCIALFSSIEQH